MTTTRLSYDDAKSILLSRAEKGGVYAMMTKEGDGDFYILDKDIAESFSPEDTLEQELGINDFSEEYCIYNLKIESGTYFLG
jgi:hypothetical protein